MTDDSPHLEILGSGTLAVTLGYTAVLLPGEFKFYNRRGWSTHRIDIPLATWQTIAELGSP